MEEFIILSYTENTSLLSSDNRLLFDIYFYALSAQKSLIEAMERQKVLWIHFVGHLYTNWIAIMCLSIEHDGDMGDQTAWYMVELEFLSLSGQGNSSYSEAPVDALR